MHQYFICNQEKVTSKLQTLTLTDKSDSEWTENYIDNKSNEKWILVRYHSEYNGGGLPVLKRLPEPTTEELIDIALSSLDKNDIIGASLELADREKVKKEDFRDKLIKQLLAIPVSKLTGFERERLKIIIYESDLYDPTNRRNIIGKHFTEIESDAEYYRVVAQNAKGILIEIDKYSS